MLHHVKKKGKAFDRNGNTENITVTEIYTEPYRKEIYFRTKHTAFVYIEVMSLPCLSRPCVATKESGFYQILGESYSGELQLYARSDIIEIAFSNSDAINESSPTEATQ